MRADTKRLKREVALLAALAVSLVSAVLFTACSSTGATTSTSSIQDTGASASSTDGAASGYEILLENQIVELEGVRNARQLGGLPAADGRTVREDRLIRSASLADATETDIETLTNAYALAAVIDLRDEAAVETSPDPAIAGVAAYHFNVWPNAQQSADAAGARREEQDDWVTYRLDLLNRVQSLDLTQYADNMYGGFALNDASIEGYHEMFRVLLKTGDGSVLYHCAHGKDRTGVATVLILSALGVDRDIIVQEYLLTNQDAYYAGRLETYLEQARLETDDEELLRGVAMLKAVDGFYLERYFKAIDDNYGSMEHYLREAMELGESELNTLREKYTA